MGAWGARLTVQSLYTRSAGLPTLASFFRFPPAALFFSLPALFAANNPEPSLSSLEIVASLLWMIAFAGETTADRQLIRFVGKPENAGRVCRSGLWRRIPRAHALFEGLIWCALALFALGSPRGWIALGCPLAVLYVAVRQRRDQAFTSGDPITR